MPQSPPNWLRAAMTARFTASNGRSGVFTRMSSGSPGATMAARNSSSESDASAGKSSRIAAHGAASRS